MDIGFYFVRYRGVRRLAFVRKFKGHELIIELIDEAEEWGRMRVYLSPQEALKMNLEWGPRLES